MGRSKDYVSLYLPSTLFFKFWTTCTALSIDLTHKLNYFSTRRTSILFFFTFPLASTAHSTSYHEVSPAFLTDVENKYLKKGLSHDLSTLNNTSPLQLLLSPRTHIKRTSYIGSIDDLCCTLFFFFAKR